MLHKLYMHLKQITREVLSMDDLEEYRNGNHNNIKDEEVDNNINNDVNNQEEITPDFRRDEETAAEITDFDDNILDRSDDKDVGNQIGNIPGWIGLALAVLSFFMMPIIFGAAAIIVGFFAKGRDANWLGNTAIALGVISIIVRLFFIPFT